MAKPTLLMLSATFPDRRGIGPGRRAWQLLQAAARTHRVSLITYSHRRATLAQWDLLTALTEQVILVPRRLRQSTVAAFGSAMTQELARQRFDLALCTTPSLTPLFRDVDAQVRVCDFNVPASHWHHRRWQAAPHATRWWHAWRQELAAITERAAADQSDLLLVRRATDLVWCSRSLSGEIRAAHDPAVLAPVLQKATPRSRRQSDSVAPAASPAPAFAQAA